MLELTTSFSQETTSWICGRPSVPEFKCLFRGICWVGRSPKKQRKHTVESTAELQMWICNKNVVWWFFYSISAVPLYNHALNLSPFLFPSIFLQAVACCFTGTSPCFVLFSPLFVFNCYHGGQLIWVPLRQPSPSALYLQPTQLRHCVFVSPSPSKP